MLICWCQFEPLSRFGVKHAIKAFLDNIFHHRVQVSFYLALVDGDDLPACGWIFAGCCVIFHIAVFYCCPVFCCRRQNISARRTVCNFRRCCITALFNRLPSPLHIQALFRAACTSAENITYTNVRIKLCYLICPAIYTFFNSLLALLCTKFSTRKSPDVRQGPELFWLLEQDLNLRPSD